MTERRVFLVVLAVALLVLWSVRGILAPFIIAAGLAYAFGPVVTAANRRVGWPRPLVVAIGYLLLIALVAVIVVLTAGKLSTELAGLSTAGPDLVASAIRNVIHADSITIAGTTVLVTELASAIHGAAAGVFDTPSGALHVAETAVDVALQAILVLIVTFYLLVDGRRIRGWALELIPHADRQRTGLLLDRIQDTLAKWLRGQLFLIVLVAIASYVFLGPVLHVHYAGAIGVLTGILEVIPLVGPLIAAAIAIVAALAAGGPTTAIIVGIGYFVLRQVEDQLLMPFVVGRAVHLHPVVTIFAVLAGLSLYGVLGGLLGVPVAAAANVVFNDVYAARVRDSPAAAAVPAAEATVPAEIPPPAAASRAASPEASSDQ